MHFQRTTFQLTCHRVQLKSCFANSMELCVNIVGKYYWYKSIRSYFSKANRSSYSWRALNSSFQASQALYNNYFNVVFMKSMNLCICEKKFTLNHVKTLCLVPLLLRFFSIYSFRFLIFEICQSTCEELVLYEKDVKKNSAFL